MNAEVFRILVFAMIPVLLVEVFLSLEYTGMNRKFDTILMCAISGTVGVMLFGAFVADGWVF